MSQVISIRVDNETVEKLNEIAKETERAKAYHVQKAIQTYIKEYADLQIALDRLHNFDDETISMKEVREMLEL